MQFTEEQKDQYLDKLALSTQQGIWMTEMALMKDQERLAQKKALLTVVEQRIENKDYNSPRDGKNEKHQIETDIANLENEVQEELITIQSGRDDLELIEQYRAKAA